MNSNIAIYLGAYTNIIHKLAILNLTSKQSILNILSYLVQLKIAYKIYFDYNAFRRDVVFFQPDTLLSISNDIGLCTILNELEIDVICANPKEPISSKLLQGSFYSVIINNPRTKQTTNIYHTNAKKNIPVLMRLNNYQTISVELL